MIVQVAAVEFDPLGYALFETLPESEEKTYSRRVTKVPVLDAGVVINDRGFADGDSQLVYRFKSPSAELDAKILRFIKYHARVRVSDRDGIFECAPVDFTKSAFESLFLLEVISKLTED